MNENPLIVVALGGNAISKPQQEGNVAQQFANAKDTARQLADLVESGCRLVITHGNGPQIGNFLLRNRMAADAIYPLPMEVACAHVQGGMGYMIGQTLTNDLAARGIERHVLTIITTVLVDQADQAFQNPSKPIGRPVNQKDADRLATKEGWAFKEVGSNRFRRVVPSPLPTRIMEIEDIRRAVAAGNLVVACGGGGIPVVCDENGMQKGSRAVIDKDRASALLGLELGADAMVILTAVDCICVDYGTETQRVIDTMTVAEAQAWMDEGQFPPGSMGPKVQAAIDFLTASDKPAARVVVGPLDKAADCLAGRAGTTITRS